jgi:hypothetical protein
MLGYMEISLSPTEIKIHPEVLKVKVYEILQFAVRPIFHRRIELS